MTGSTNREGDGPAALPPAGVGCDAGWYPDPLGSGQRYWDGAKWGLKAPEPASPDLYGAGFAQWCRQHGWRPKAVAGIAIAVTLAVVLLLVVLVAGKETGCEREARQYVERIGGTNGDYMGYLEGCRLMRGPNA